MVSEAAAFCRDLLQVQILRSHPQITGPHEFRGRAPVIPVLTHLPGDSDSCLSLRIAAGGQWLNPTIDSHLLVSLSPEASQERGDSG